MYSGSVNLATGNLRTAHHVCGWSGKGQGIQFTLYHNSQSTRSSALGPKWSHSYHWQIIDEALALQKVEPRTLTIHADRGAAMTSKLVAVLLSDLGVTRTHSRPHVSNDNPYSEAQFKTLKYRPEFPARFGCIEDARAVCSELFRWYNGEHYHAGIALLTPAAVHYGKASAIIAQRQTALDAAFIAHPERFVNRPPKHPTLPNAVWINPPEARSSQESISIQ